MPAARSTSTPCARSCRIAASAPTQRLHSPELDGEAIASAFSDGDQELPLLEVDDLLPPSNPDFIVPIDLDEIAPSDLLGEPPTFGESGPLDFEPAPLFGEPTGARPVTPRAVSTRRRLTRSGPRMKHPRS